MSCGMLKVTLYDIFMFMLNLYLLQIYIYISLLHQDRETYCFCYGRPSVCVSFHLSVIKSCPLRILKTRLSCFHETIQIFTIMRRCAEHKNSNCGLPTFGVMALLTSQIVILVIKSCPPRNLKTVWDIFTKLYRNVFHHKTTCRTHNHNWDLPTFGITTLWTPPRSATFFRGDWSWNIFYGHSLPSADSRRAVVSFWRKNVYDTG